jgi:hypothetical protein
MPQAVIELLNTLSPEQRDCIRELRAYEAHVIKVLAGSVQMYKSLEAIGLVESHGLTPAFTELGKAVAKRLHAAG